MPPPRLDLDGTFRALADPSRRDFLVRLGEGPMSVTELARGTDLTLAAVVQHVQILQTSGLITTRKTGRVRMCSLHPAGLSAVEEWLSERRRTWERRLDALGDILDQQGDQSADGEHE